MKAPLSRAFSWRTNILPIANLGTFIATVIVNALGSTGAVGKGAVGAISDRNPTEVVPAGYAFSIWGLIYALQALMILFQLPMICLGQYPKSVASVLSISSSTQSTMYDNQSGNNAAATQQSEESNSAKSILRYILDFNIGGQNEMYDRMGLWYAFANIFNLTWIIVFVYEAFWASFVVILILSLLVLGAYVSIGIDYGKRGQERKVKNELFTAYPNSSVKRYRNLYTWEYWVVQAPFSIYLGWLTAATLLTLFLSVKSTWPAGSRWETEIYWSVAAQLFAAVCAGALAWLRCDFIYSTTVAWAILGIYVKHQNDQNEVVKIAAICCFVVSIVVATAAFLTASYTRVRRLFKKYVWKNAALNNVENMSMKLQTRIIEFFGSYIFELKRKHKSAGADGSSDSASSDDNHSPRYSKTLPM